MKRVKTPLAVPISKTHTYFTWNQCQDCKLEFRREPGWKYVYKTWVGPGGYVHPEYHHLCIDCAPTEQDAYNFATRKLTPTCAPPPSPPPKRIVKDGKRYYE